MKRNRLHQLLWIGITTAIGIASRKYSVLLPMVVAEYAGDVCWSLMVFWLSGFLFPAKSTGWVAAFALLFSYCMELTQLYHSLFIDSIRATPLGELIFGFTFVWSDLFCYAIGVLIGMLIEKTLRIMHS